MPVIKAFKRRFDQRRYNGASFLGLKGIVVKSHGSADDFAFLCAIEKAAEEVRGGMLHQISEHVEKWHRERQTGMEKSAPLSNLPPQDGAGANDSLASYTLTAEQGAA